MKKLILLTLFFTFPSLITSQRASPLSLCPSTCSSSESDEEQETQPVIFSTIIDRKKIILQHTPELLAIHTEIKNIEAKKERRSPAPTSFYGEQLRSLQRNFVKELLRIQKDQENISNSAREQDDRALDQFLKALIAADNASRLFDDTKAKNLPLTTMLFKMLRAAKEHMEETGASSKNASKYWLNKNRNHIATCQYLEIEKAKLDRMEEEQSE